MISSAMIEKIWESEKKNIDAFFITNPNNIGYLCDFWGSYGKVVITKKKIFLITDARYIEKAKMLEKKNLFVVERTREENFWEQLFEGEKISTIAIEAEHTSLSEYSALNKIFGKSISVQKRTRTIEHLRIQKQEEELKNIEKAAQIADKSLEKICTYIAVGKTEKEIAWQFEHIAREEFGAEGLSFPTIVAFGKHSAIPHHEPTEQKLQKGMPILIDCGVKKNHYCSDMTRSFFFGKPSSEWRNAYDAVKKAQEQGIEKIRIGNTFSLPDIVARESLGDLAVFFTHSFGHGVGLDIHEAPTLLSKTNGVFLEKMVVTAEPGVYFSGKFGIRIEDILVVEKGRARILSKSECSLLP